MAKQKSVSGKPPATASASSQQSKRKGTNPFAFIQEVRREGEKVTWTTRREAALGTVMVLIMVLVMAIFFWIVDQFFIVTIVCMLLNSPTCPYDFLSSGPSLTGI